MRMDDRSERGPRQSGRAAVLVLAAAAISGPPATAAAVGSVPDASVICLHDGLEPSKTARLIDEALGVLAQSGHDPAAYRLELRMEDAQSPDAPSLGADRVPSVVFVPAHPGARYPVRVHPANPCVISWVWQPGRLTAWQREVVARARQQIETLPHEATDPNDLRVLEARELVRVELRRGERSVRVTLSKADLASVDRAGEDATFGR